MRRHTRLLLGASLGLLVAACGCIPNYPNEPLQTFDPQVGYRADNLPAGGENSDSVLVVLTFSGGGTRAAALAYGALLGLGELDLPGSGTPENPRSLLEEVDFISSVSGGSFTALGYGLWGDGLFDGHFEKSFLRHNIQGNLVLMGVNPINIFTGANKSELAAHYYDKHIFKNATYGDLLARGTRPLINVNATDMARQEQFQFVQFDFDLMGSDLSKLPVAWAAASSSAFPILLDPLRFKYYHNEAMDDAVRARLTSETRQIRSSSRLWALDLVDREAFEETGAIDVQEKDHNYMYLIDGGVVDNIGITPFFAAFRDGGIRALVEAGKVDHLAIIMVDAGTAPPNKIESSAATPGGLASLSTTATSGIHTSTWILKTITKAFFLQAYGDTKRAYQLCAPGRARDIPPEYTIDFYVADVNFTSLKDYEERQRFLSMPTTFALDDAHVDALIAVGKKLIKEDPEIKRLLKNLGS